MFMKKERNIFMTKLWDTLRSKTQQMLLKQENEELTESQQKQAELEPIEGVDWEKLYKKEHKLRQEAETETILVKGIGMNSPEMKDAKAKLGYLQDELDRVKRENNDLHNKVAALLDAVDPEKNLKKARESGL
tara:strand:- start:24 stop:422 length:399 start_codon:yes stop_codon:yes gene_type:complete